MFIYIVYDMKELYRICLKQKYNYFVFDDKFINYRNLNVISFGIN